MAEATPAPVWPAVTTASASPSRTRRMHTLMLASRLRRTATAGGSSMPTVSEACTMRTWDGSGSSMKGADARLVADEDDLHVGVRPRPVDGAAHDLLGRVVAAHGVDGDARALEVADLGPPAEGLDIHASVDSIGPSGGPGPSGALLGGLLLADLHRLAAAVPAAVGAGVVRALGLVAVRALLQLGTVSA